MARCSRELHALDRREIEGMKKQPGKDMMVLGRGTIVSQLTRHGLKSQSGDVLLRYARPN
jgi:hypothetical protein